MNRSQISNDFNFSNELDISNTRKDKTEHFFSKEGFQFEDFMNVGDRTFKSDKFESKLQQNNSKLSRDNSKIAREEQEELPSKLLDEIDYNIRQSRTPHPTPQEELPPSQHPPASSPKFAQTTKSIPISPRKPEFTLRRPTQKKEMPSQGQPSKGPQDEWVSLEGQIRFYLGESQRLEYEQRRLEEEGEQLMISFDPALHQGEIRRFGEEIKGINKQIEEQRQLQGQLTRMVLQLQQEYDTLFNSVKTSQFPRPTKVGDEAKALIDDINALKGELEAIERDEGSLNLSSTLVGVPSSALVKSPSGVASPRRQQDELIKERLSEIMKIQRESEYPRYLLNLKMACLKTEWVLFSNSELEVNVSYRQTSLVQVRIGNKLGKDLERFSLRQEGVLKLQGETIAGRSYYSHSFEVTPVSIAQLFSKVQLTYTIFEQERRVVLFVPLGMTTFGQFAPETQKEFDKDAGSAPFETVGSFRPFDRKIITSIQDLEIYMPNLIFSEDSACGLFVLPFRSNERSVELVVFKQKGESLSVGTHGDNWPMVRLLEFIFTL